MARAPAAEPQPQKRRISSCKSAKREGGGAEGKLSPARLQAYYYYYIIIIIYQPQGKLSPARLQAPAAESHCSKSPRTHAHTHASTHACARTHAHARTHARTHARKHT